MSKPMMDSIVQEGFKQGNWADDARDQKGGNSGLGGSMNSTDLLNVLQADLVSDVCGMLPVSSFNYVFGMVCFYVLFEAMEDKLKEARNPMYVQAYEL